MFIDYCIPRMNVLWFIRYAAASANISCERNNLKNLARIASIFYIEIDIGESIAGKRVWPGLIIEGPPSPPPK